MNNELIFNFKLMDKSEIVNSTVNKPLFNSNIKKSTLVEFHNQNNDFNYLYKVVDVFSKTGNINFVNVSLAALLISTSIFLLIIVTLFVLKLNLCKAKKQTGTIDKQLKYEVNCEKHIIKTMSTISDKFDQNEFISIANNDSITRKDSTTSKQNLLCKCISKPKAYDQQSTKLILINCTSCIDSQNYQKRSTNKANRSAKHKLSLQPIKRLKPKYTTQFSIRFHKFSFRSPSFSTLTGNKQIINTVDKTTMNQRCCLSVSVVPFDRHGNSNANSNPNANNSNNSKSKKNNKKSASNKQLEDDLNDSYSKQPASDSMNKTTTTKTSSQMDLNKPEVFNSSISTLIDSVTSSEHPKSATLLNHHEFHKIDQLIANKKCNQLTNEISINTDTEKLSKQVALFKQKNICNKEPSPSLQSMQSNSDTLNINIGNTNHNINNTISSRYQHFERRKSSSGNSTHLMNTNDNVSIQACEEIFDFSLRINKLRFIDDSASSTALTSPCESMSHLYGFNKHVPQQQHKLLNSYAYGSNNSQLSVSTSSSRTVSMAPSTNGSCASTPVSISNKTFINNQKRMLVPVQRQDNIKSSTETICSNETEIKKETKQFQHELLENYRKNTQLVHQQDNEDDEEIKNIILNNLNEKLKKDQSAVINAKHQHIRYKHHYQYNRNQKKSTISPVLSATTTEIDSSSSECDQALNRHYHANYSSRHKILNKTLSFIENTTSSTTSTTSSTATQSPQLDCGETICKSCSVMKQTNNMPTLTVAAADSNCKYCKLLLNYETTTTSSNSSSSKNVSSPSPLNASLINQQKLGFQFGYSPGNRFKNKGDDKVYAYDNFDCINECLEENEILNQIIDSKINSRKQVIKEEDEEEDDEQTSILVEDGFIRMSSPIGNDDKQQDTNQNSKEEVKNRLKTITNFPNVGSSPLSEEFLNSECSSSENEDEEREPILKHAIDEQIDQISNDNNSDSFDGIIILSSLSKKSSTNKDNNELTDNYLKSTSREALSLSDDDEIIVEEDEDDETPKNTSILISQDEYEALTPVVKKATNSESANKLVPHSIMKQKGNYSELNQIIYNRISNLEQSSSSSIISSASTNLTSSPLNTNLNNNNNISASSNLLLTTQSMLSSTSSTGANQTQQKPKVRFNLDINYEKEREWNRASKLIGDASKTQIEWTQEVEV